MEGDMLLKMSRRLILYAALAAPLMLASPDARAADAVKVAASFTVLGDMVKQIGGDRVEVKIFVGPNGDAHVYEPTPGDVKALADSKILVVNGLGLEGWMARLQKSSGFKGKVITATTGIKTRQMEEEEHGKTQKITDPHAWQSLANGRIYAQNIRDGLIAADPDGKDIYQANAAKFLADIDTLAKDVKDKIAALPPARRKIITTHDAFGYFGATYGMEFIAPEGVSTESEASAKDVAKIIRQIKAEKIPAVFLENVTDPRLLDQIARETGAKIGGTLYSDALSDEKGPAATYLDMFRHNAATLSEALSS
jgi:zinc/manganese transport system substrate-binding protein